VDWLERWNARRRAASAARAADRVLAWEQAAGTILRLCQDALDDEHAGTGDIGTALDRLDRQLHALKDTAADLPAALRRGAPDLARAAAGITEDLYRLRNLTAQYLIRAQGPVPPYLDGPASDDALRRDHRRIAFDQVGGEARRLATDLDRRLREASRSAETRFPADRASGRRANRD
jgi:hypothetical protein